MRPIKQFIILLIFVAGFCPITIHAADGTNTNNLLSLIANLTPADKLNCLKRLDEIYRTKDYAAVVKACDEAITDHPDWGEVYAQRALANIRLRNLAAAKTDADGSVRLAPKFALSHYAVGRVAAENKDHSRALAEYDKACELDPFNGFYLIGRALEKRNINDDAGAIADLSQAIKFDPRASYLYRERGITRLLKFPDGALADF